MLEFPDGGGGLRHHGRLVLGQDAVPDKASETNADKVRSQPNTDNYIGVLMWDDRASSRKHSTLLTSCSSHWQRGRLSHSINKILNRLALFNNFRCTPRQIPGFVQCLPVSADPSGFERQVGNPVAN